MIINFEDFKQQVRRRKGINKKHKITNSYGTYDYFKHYRKHRPKDKKYVLNESQYFAIVRNVNILLGEQLVETNSVTFPKKMGTIEIRKYSISPKIGEDGKVIFNAPIDWDKTLKLWFEDEEARQNKTLIKVDNREVFRTIYSRVRANYNNKSFYAFRLTKAVKIQLNQKIKTGRMDAFEYIGGI